MNGAVSRSLSLAMALHAFTSAGTSWGGVAFDGPMPSATRKPNVAKDRVFPMSDSPLKPLNAMPKVTAHRLPLEALDCVLTTTQGLRALTVQHTGIIVLSLFARSCAVRSLKGTVTRQSRPTMRCTKTITAQANVIYKLGMRSHNLSIREVSRWGGRIGRS